MSAEEALADQVGCHVAAVKARHEGQEGHRTGAVDERQAKGGHKEDQGVAFPSDLYRPVPGEDEHQTAGDADGHLNVRRGDLIEEAFLPRKPVEKRADVGYLYHYVQPKAGDGDPGAHAKDQRQGGYLWKKANGGNASGPFLLSNLMCNPTSIDHR
ncbi:hypothetical protein TYRP_012144 [Tyrophagus putrescentiae]|nr:hypothetical protein TYRP_012144 [Tyrophagus putrescentiae]